MIYAAGTISPGPSFTLIVRLAASGARSAALGATVGFSVGAATYATLTMTGFALIITQVGWLMTSIQVAGGCYLIYLGLSAWMSKPAALDEAPEPVLTRGAKKGFQMGLIVELSNPKSIAFFVSIFAVAVPPDAALWVKTTIIVGGFLVDLAWYGLAATLLSTRPVQNVYRKFAVFIDRALGTVLAVFGLRLIAERF
ncbi:MAG: LysE family transporter [Tabrizicola sp.]|nr:LysE family transporter [Tabrizicola sp.]